MVSLANFDWTILVLLASGLIGASATVHAIKTLLKLIDGWSTRDEDSEYQLVTQIRTLKMMRRNGRNGSNQATQRTCDVSHLYRKADLSKPLNYPTGLT